MSEARSVTAVQLLTKEMPCGHFVTATPERFRIWRENPGQTFRFMRCPEGHEWMVGSELEEITAALKQAQEQVNALGLQNGQLRKSVDELVDERNRLAKRAQAGVCSKCHRTFQQLARHMASKHKG